nr:hypothetical protein [Tanacetum cinerariifolium]
VTPYRRRKGKEIMVESETLKKKKVQEQIDAQVARDLEEQLAREDQRMSEQSQQRIPLTKKQQREFYTVVLRNQVRWKANHFKVMTLELDLVWKKLHDFVPIVSKEEAGRFKRKGTRFEQESTKKLKTSEEVPKEVKSPDEVSEEKGRIVRNKMHKAFPLPVIEFPLAEEVPTGSEESYHCQKKREATAKRIALLICKDSIPQSLCCFTSTDVPKIKVTRPRHAKPIITKTNSPTRRYLTRNPSPKVSYSPPRVTAVKAVVVNAAQGKQGKWEWKPKCPVLGHVSCNTSAS